MFNLKRRDTARLFFLIENKDSLLKFVLACAVGVHGLVVANGHLGEYAITPSV